MPTRDDQVATATANPDVETAIVGPLGTLTSVEINYRVRPVSLNSSVRKERGAAPHIDRKNERRDDTQHVEETQSKVKQQAELKARREAELKIKQQAELKARREAELKIKQQAELKARRQAELKEAKQEAELKVKQEEKLQIRALEQLDEEYKKRTRQLNKLSQQRSAGKLSPVQLHLHFAFCVCPYLFYVFVAPRVT